MRIKLQILILSSAVSFSLFCQTPLPTAAPLRATMGQQAGENLPAQRIGANDLVAVAVYDAPELTRTVRVSTDGMIRLPMMKKQIKALGLMPSDLETAIASELKSEELLVDPVVTVTMAEYHSHPISVAGSVRNPITFQASTPVSLLEALNRAGGLDAKAGLEILVSRTKVVAGEDKPVTLTQRIPVKGLIDAADPELNIMLTGGEDVRVPEIGKVTVVGMVKKPGSFPMQDSAETTVLQMVALAEGITGVSSDQAFIYRREGNGSKNEIPVQLKDIMLRKSPDVVLMANDLLYIPENKNKKMRLSAMEKLLTFGTTAGATALAYGLIR